MSIRKTIEIHSENAMKHKNAFCAKYAEFSTVTADVLSLLLKGKKKKYKEE
jgi:hypothetical protein